MEPSLKSSLEGLKIASFESRRAQEMANLIRSYGGDPLVGPSMREVPLAENGAVFELIRGLEAGEVDFLILLTGVGTKALAASTAPGYPPERIVAAMHRTVLVARGPKPVAALKDLGLKPAVSVPEPNTWRELLAELEARADLRGQRVAIQEYGIPNHDLIAGLEARGARVTRVPVYRWALPEDVQSLRGVIREILAGRVEIAVFTNARQVEHAFQVAGEERQAEALRHAFGRVVVASVGPVCSEALQQFGLTVDLEPDHPKMGHLMSAVARRARDMLEAKRQKS
jgi:uroporphyrinogen-III synthase